MIQSPAAMHLVYFLAFVSTIVLVPATVSADLQTKASASVRMQRTGVGAHFVDSFDSTEVDTGIVEYSDWAATLTAQAKAHAAYRTLKAFATILYSAGSTSLNFESAGRAYYTDEIRFVPSSGVWGNPDEDYFIELVFHAEGAKNISGWFSSSDCVLSVAWSARGSNQEPKTLYATLDNQGDYRFTISGYRGDLIDLKVTLDASLYATGARLKKNQGGTLDFFHTLHYTGSILRDSEYQIIAEFDADNHRIAGQPGWTIVPPRRTIESRFQSEDHGWTGAALSVNNLSQVVEVLPIFWDSESISLSDNDNQWTTFVAPAEFLGDRSDWLGGEIAFDMKHQTTGMRIDGPAVFLVGNGTVLCSPWIVPTESWQRFTFSLIPSDWHVNSPNGPEPSMPIFYSVLSNLEALYIIGDYVSGVETTWIDNVQLKHGLSPDSSGDGFVDMEDLARFAAQWSKSGCINPDWCDGQDFTRNGSVTLDDLYFLILNWLHEVH